MIETVDQFSLSTTVESMKILFPFNICTCARLADRFLLLFSFWAEPEIMCFLITEQQKNYMIVPQDASVLN